MLRTMAILIGLLNVTLTAATAVLVLLAKERLHLGSVGYGRAVHLHGGRAACSARRSATG